LPRAPASTLFPYTTLFRSLGRLEIAVESRAPDGPGLDEAERIALIVDGTRLAGKLQQAQLCSPPALRSLLRAIDEAVDGTVASEDRKSTRLNSSHDQISYA